MHQNKKQPYLAPAVKVVEVKVERGMAGTDFNNTPISDDLANEAYGETQSINNIFGSTI